MDTITQAKLHWLIHEALGDHLPDGSMPHIHWYVFTPVNHRVTHITAINLQTGEPIKVLMLVHQQLEDEFSIVVFPNNSAKTAVSDASGEALIAYIDIHITKAIETLKE